MRAVFIDKDGTLIENLPYNVDPSRIELTPGAAAGICKLRARGYRIFIVSNQPGVGLGIFPAQALEAVEMRLRQLVPIDAFYYCPHRPDDGCACRKPSPAMLIRAAHQHGLALAECWMVGDILDDIEAGRRAGCRTVLMDNGNETEWRIAPERVPDFIAPNLAQAADRILDDSLVPA